MTYTDISFWYTVLSPLILVLSILLVKNILWLRNQHKTKKNFNNMDFPTWGSYQKIEPHKNIKLKWKPPRGSSNTPVYQMNSINIFKSDKSRKSTGYNMSSYAFGLGLSTNKRQYINSTSWTNMGPAEITFTYQDIWIRGENMNYRYRIKEIEEISLSSNDDLIIKLSRAAWPIRIEFEKLDEYKEFANMFYTLYYQIEDTKYIRKKPMVEKEGKESRNSIEITDFIE